MKAARAHEGQAKLVVEAVPDPVLRPGSVIVRIEACFAAHFTSKIVAGAGYMTPPRPFIPGMDAIGVVESVAGDVRGLTVGDRVYCDSYYEPRYPGTTGERVFIGNFALGPHSEALLKEWPDGGYAEKMLLPAACVYPIRPANDVPASTLCRLGWLGTAFGALRKGGMPAGATVAVLGASGILGSSGVIAALGLGAGKVYAVGRRKGALSHVAAIDERVEVAIDPAALPMLDFVLSSIDGEDCAMIEACLPKVKRFGTVALIGAPKAPLHVPPSLLMRGDIALRGSLWFEKADVDAMLSLIAAGSIDLSILKAQEFALADVNKALAAADTRDNPLHHVAVLCG